MPISPVTRSDQLFTVSGKGKPMLFLGCLFPSYSIPALRLESCGDRVIATLDSELRRPGSTMGPGVCFSSMFRVGGRQTLRVAKSREKTIRMSHNSPPQKRKGIWGKSHLTVFMGTIRRLVFVPSNGSTSCYKMTVYFFSFLKWKIKIWS